MQQKIKECTCDHKAQDQYYGRYHRLMNWARKANRGLGAWRYTVCLREHS